MKTHEIGVASNLFMTPPQANALVAAKSAERKEMDTYIRPTNMEFVASYSSATDTPHHVKVAAADTITRGMSIGTAAVSSGLGAGVGGVFGVVAAAGMSVISSIINVGNFLIGMCMPEAYKKAPLGIRGNEAFDIVVNASVKFGAKLTGVVVGTVGAGITFVVGNLVGGAQFLVGGMLNTFGVKEADSSPGHSGASEVFDASYKASNVWVPEANVGKMIGRAILSCFGRARREATEQMTTDAKGTVHTTDDGIAVVPARKPADRTSDISAASGSIV